MTLDPRAQDAIDAIGKAKKDDWKIEPTKHAEMFGKSAPALAAILKDPSVEAAAKAYEDNDKGADKAQTEFKRTARWANGLVLTIALIGAAVLFVGVVRGGEDGGGPEQVPLIVLGAVSVTAGVFASHCLMMIREGGMLKRWAGLRSEAEKRRSGYFEVVLRTEADTGSSQIPIESLKLEYFRRFLFDSQMRYFEKRGREHSEEARRLVTRRVWMVTIAGLAAGLSGILAGIHTGLSVIAVGGVGATAIASFISIREGIDQNRQNAARYGNTHQTLGELGLRLEDVRNRAVKGDLRPVLALYDSTKLILMEEHRQWIEEMKERNIALTWLDERLKQMAAEREQNPETGQGSA